jgi:glutathione S-transferase
MASITVHGIPTSMGVSRVLTALHEKGLQYNFVSVDFAAKEHKSPAFLAKNPMGQLPAFEDGDLTLFESRAITQYISHKYADKGTPLIYKDDLRKSAILAVWMEVEGQHFEPASTALIFQLVFHPVHGKPTDEAVVKANEEKLAKVLDVYENRLSESKYLGGDTFSLADLHHLANIVYLWDTPMKKLFTSRPKVSAWCDDILARDSWTKVVDMRKA